MMMMRRQPSDPYYDLARKMQKMERSDLSLCLKQFHQSAVDDTMQAVIEVIRRVVPDSELADKLTSDIGRIYVAGGHIADDRRYLARTEALLCAVVREFHGGSLTLDVAKVDEACRSGDGVDTSRPDPSKLEVTPQPAKFSGV